MGGRWVYELYKGPYSGQAWVGDGSMSFIRVHMLDRHGWEMGL